MVSNNFTISSDSADGTFDGRVKVLVTDTEHLKKLPDLPGVWTAERVNEE